MVDERKSGLEVAIQREVAHREKVPNPKNELIRTLSRSPSFTDWTVTDQISNGSPQHSFAIDHENTSSPKLIQSSTEHPRLTFPSPRPQKTMEKSLIKIEPDSDELSSACQDWIRPSDKVFDKKLLTRHSSSPLVPFSREIPTRTASQANTITHQRPKYFPMPNIPTKPRSSLKRKAIIDVQESPNPQPSSRNSTAKTVNKYGAHINNLLFCELCQVSCSGGTAMQDHLKGRAHKAKMVYMQLKKSNCTVKQPTCNVCQISCTDWSLMEMHLKGKKHKAKLHELEENRTGGIVVKKKPVFCELCHISCMNEDLFKMHLKGKQHVTRQEMKRRRMM